MSFFMKDKRVFRMSFLARMMVVVLVVLIVGVSRSMLMAQIYEAPNGNVGIKTSEPQRDLEINGITQSNELWLNENGKILGIGNGTFQIGEQNENWCFIGGYVGIGTSVPLTRLEISQNGSGIQNVLTLTNKINASNVGTSVDFRNSEYNGFTWLGGRIAIQRNGAGRGHDIIFSNRRDSETDLETISEAMRIDEFGNVGIGTSVPLTRLEISQNGSGIQNVLTLTNKINASNVGTSVDFRNSEYNGLTWLGGRITIQRNGAGRGHDIIFSNRRDSETDFEIISEAMRINKFGNIGIGTSSPSSKLDVAGTINASSGYLCTSDSRFKKNITLYQNALEKILDLRGVTFFWNTEKYKDRSFGKEKQIGFIAQEVEKVIPEIVYTNDKGFKTMSYDRLTAVLVEAVKELKAEKDGEIAKSNEKIAALESENEALKQRLAKFEALADRLALVEKELENQIGRRLAEIIE